jgi:molecular chaperone HtpG
MSEKGSGRFQVDLSGIISVLSKHLYSTPRVAFRELLQNGVDAISARKLIDPKHEGSISFEIIPGDSSPTLVVEDNGIGLTEQEVHQFLATIGGSSKRTEKSRAQDTFIGQFGIGLLSCFVLSDEIVVITRSATSADASGIEWRGQGSGTYGVRLLEGSHSVGTRVYLKIKPECRDLCTPEMVRETMAEYGEFLPVTVELSVGDKREAITAKEAPWNNGSLPMMAQAELGEAGRRFFEENFIDMVPITSRKAGLDGIAFISGQARGLQSKPRHRAYVRGMLLSTEVDGLAPDWAVFVNVLANTTKLHPTASREAFVTDDLLDQAREDIGLCLLSYLRRLAEHDRNRLVQIIRIHSLALKSLALENDDVLRLIAPWLEFETSLGHMTFQEILKHKGSSFCTSVDRFRQLAAIASAEGRCLINAGYVFEADLMQALSQEYLDAELEELSAMDFSDQLDELDADEAANFEALLDAAGEVLDTHRCRVEVRSFQPASLPILYVQNDAADARRALEKSEESADDFFASILGDISGRITQDAWNVCYLNAQNNLIQKLARVRDSKRLRVTVEVLYLQALLLGRYPLNNRELRQLSDGLVQLVEFGL